MGEQTNVRRDKWAFGEQVRDMIVCDKVCPVADLSSLRRENELIPGRDL